MDTSDLSPAELRVWQAFPRGEDVDFRPPGETGPPPEDCGPERTVRAEVLRAALLNCPQNNGEIPALRIGGARITGVLDLSYGTIEHAVRLSDCRFEEAPVLYATRLRQLILSGSVLPGLAAALGPVRRICAGPRRLARTLAARPNHPSTSSTREIRAHAESTHQTPRATPRRSAGQALAQMEGILQLSDCRFHGYVRLGGARIDGAVFLDGAEITPPDTVWPALRLGHATIGDNLWAPGLRAYGEVLLSGASVAGAVTLNDARLSHPGRAALDAQTLTVGTDFHLRRVRADGWIGLRGANVAGRLDLSYARLSNPGDTALRGSSCTLGELWLRKGPHIEGTLNLRRAQIDVLVLERDVLPEAVLFNGLTYTTLTPHEPAEQRLPMLDRDGEGYLPHSYEQLTAAYQRVGDDHGASAVQLAKLRRHRRTLPAYRRAWGHLQEATVGYGFRPLLAAGWLLSLLALGSLAFGLHHPHPLKADEAPEFNPVFFTLDLLLPVITFGQEGAFDPTGWHQALAYTLVIAGWVLATTVFAGVSRTVSRQ